MFSLLYFSQHIWHFGGFILFIGYAEDLVDNELILDPKILVENTLLQTILIFKEKA